MSKSFFKKPFYVETNGALVENISIYFSIVTKNQLETAHNY
jgi:hypothetical protein